jgi:uncharacterized RDD family membrane protein YckC
MTPEEISRGYDASIIARRWLGARIDFAVICITLLSVDHLLGNELYRKTRPVWLFVLIAYFPITEGLTGRSLGKVSSATKVVNQFGQPPGILKAIIRTLTRLIEVNPFLAGGIPAGLIVNFSKTHQRWGDMLAGTFVIKSKDLSRIIIPPPVVPT